MKVHIFKDEHVYNLALLEFLHNNTDLTNHRFVFQCKPSGRVLPIEPGKVVYLPGFKNLDRVKKMISAAETVYFHLLPMGPSIFYWYFNRAVFSKVVWIFWGADIYEFRLRYKNLKHFLYHLARGPVIRKIRHIAGFLEGDYQLIRKHYHTSATYHEVVYPIPTNFGLCDDLLSAPQEVTGHKKTIILLGNSGSQTNRHLEAFDFLRHFRDQDIEIICPLSYGSKKKSYINQVIREGKMIFGDKFNPLLGFIPPEQYTGVLNEIDIALMNHDRQQGLGNTLSLLYLGKKVFLRPGTTSYSYFTQKGIRVFDISQVERMSWAEFTAIQNDIPKSNRDIIKFEFSNESYQRRWNEILNL